MASKATWLVSNIALTAEASRMLGDGTLKLLPSERRGEKRKVEKALGKGKGMGGGDRDLYLYTVSILSISNFFFFILLKDWL
jgi:hypothetical protein